MTKRLTWEAIQSLDPDAPPGGEERWFLCPLCSQGEPRADNYRYLKVNTFNGFAFCCWCHAVGRIPEACVDRPVLSMEQKFQLIRELKRELASLGRPKTEEKKVNTRYAPPPRRRKKQ